MRRTRHNPLNPSADDSIRTEQQVSEQSLHRSLNRNIEMIRNESGNSPDIVIQTYYWNNIRDSIAVLYTTGLVDSQIVLRHIVEPLQAEGRQLLHKEAVLPDEDRLDQVKEVLTTTEVKETNELDNIYDFLLSGSTVVLLDGCATALIASSAGGEERSVSESSTQTVIRGPRDAFIESIGTNTALIRRRIKSLHLWLEMFRLGRVTGTQVGMMYIDGIANKDIVAEVRLRLTQIDIDGILESGYVEELIQDKTFTPFPTVQNTDRPDVAAAALLEGRIVILVDGTPFVLICPTQFIQFFQASEDYYQRWDIASLIRLLRYFSFVISLLAPSIYLAVTTYHHELIPTELIVTLVAQREGVPLPAFVEALMMEVMFEVLREAGTRMGRAIGSSISIVGTLVIGQAAVEAGIVSAAMVIVVASTAIANFVSPSFNIGISARILRFILMVLAATFGLYGVTIGIIAITLHMCSLRSFGVPYLGTIAPFSKHDQEDVLIRVPRWAMLKRPVFMKPVNNVRTRPEADDEGRLS
ncbi:spore germination protein [Paenibacillus massiliensis]|uniref:spore germination protein n=1 Tax=Paenibacillus massiliensis TaxID=225917 RepID=UPI00037A4EE2|nr:spore germination protein [Paenibacillus massiliensis]